MKFPPPFIINKEHYNECQTDRIQIICATHFDKNPPRLVKWYSSRPRILSWGLMLVLGILLARFWFELSIFVAQLNCKGCQGSIHPLSGNSQGFILPPESRLSQVQSNPWEPALTGSIWPLRAGSHGFNLTPESRLSGAEKLSLKASATPMSYINSQ